MNIYVELVIAILGLLTIIFGIIKAYINIKKKEGNDNMGSKKSSKK